MDPHICNNRLPGRAAGERGTALIVALMLTIILTFLGFGLLTRSLLVTNIAGAERWSTKAFYAADSGFAAAKARLSVRRTEAFNYQLADLRFGTEQRGLVDVQVSDLNSLGAPQPAPGTQVGGGQDPSSEPLFLMLFKGTSQARQDFTRSERVISATLTYGPAPLLIPAGG